MKYRTIVADPPWRYRTTLPPFSLAGERSAVPYQTMSIEEVCALPVRDLAAPDAHLYLWTTSTHLEHGWTVARAWGFEYSTLLVWCKRPRGGGGFPTYAVATEFILFCHRGDVSPLTRVGRNWWEWPRGLHSEKPEAFVDLVESVSHEPRIELFARRNRLGWDTWGNEALNQLSLWEWKWRLGQAR